MNLVEEPLDELYFQWLYRQVGRAGTQRSKTHWKLFKHMFTREFVWLVPNDDNRLQEGMGLRWEFVAYSELTDVEASWMYQECSILEMLMAFSRRVAFEGEGDPRDWFWLFLKNLGLDEFTDSSYDGFVDNIDEILQSFVYRNYHPDGRGGIFPLQNSDVDQRKVELWYQMSMFLHENQG